MSPDRNDFTVTEASHLLRDYVDEAVGAPWEEALVVAELSDDSGLTYGRYLAGSENHELLCFDTDYRLYFMMDALRQAMRDKIGVTWRRAMASLTASDDLVTITFDYYGTTTE
ncbi:MAG: hypothetical protein KDI03_03505 [Anaerolineae bacterium]|nr:hypothetical protein [Anaerolineae bacterium]MCB0205179.1 hypothetical protein [Anaerolineae bacterium]